MLCMLLSLDGGPLTVTVDGQYANDVGVSERSRRTLAVKSHTTPTEIALLFCVNDLTTVGATAA